MSAGPGIFVGPRNGRCENRRPGPELSGIENIREAQRYLAPVEVDIRRPPLFPLRLLPGFHHQLHHLSDHVEQVFYFASNWPQGFQSIPTIGKVVEVRDLEGRYMKVGEWQNTDAQRRTMVDYPAEALAFDDA